MAQPKAVENGLVCVQQRWFQVVVPRETQQFAFSNLDERYQITSNNNLPMILLRYVKSHQNCPKFYQKMALLSKRGRSAEIAELAVSALLTVQ